MNNLEESSLAKLNTDSLINIILKLKNEYDIKINRMTKYRDNSLKVCKYLEDHIYDELDYTIICPCEECNFPIKKWFDENSNEMNNSNICDNCKNWICEECACVKECGDIKNIIWCPDCMEKE